MALQSITILVPIVTVIRTIITWIFTTVEIIDKKCSVCMVYPVVLVQPHPTLDTPTIATRAETSYHITGPITTITRTVSIVEAISTSFEIAQNSVN